MSEIDEKLDTALFLAYRAAVQEAEAGGTSLDDEQAAVSFILQFDGDLAPIEALGFEPHSVFGNDAMGMAKFSDLPAIAAHPNVRWMAAGDEFEPTIDVAARDVKARATSTGRVGNPGGDGVWHVPTGGGALTEAGDATGAGVIVAIIDTGIDFAHPMFMSALTPARTTRILRIWDLGLVPGSLAEAPDSGRLGSTQTYGVEYDKAEIDAALAGGPAVLHKDCSGHGTHVAGIAAGGRLFPAGGNANRVGIAPEADIIAVKLLDMPSSIRFRTAAGPGAVVPPENRFRDAVLYCLRTAKALGKPVVINMSFGRSREAGDGLDDSARFIDQVMDPAHTPDNDHFPKGAIIVKAAGNDGSAGRAAKITVPAAAGEITVPFELEDSRGGTDDRWKECARSRHNPFIFISFWYRRATPHTAVTFALSLPHDTRFSGDMGIGGFLDRGFVVRPGPPKKTVWAPVAPNVHKVLVRHEGTGTVTHPAGGTLRRHRVLMALGPKISGSDVRYQGGIYEMRIKAPAGTEIFAICSRVPWGGGKAVNFKVAATMADGTPRPTTGLDVVPEFSAADPLGKHAITVTAYDDTNGATAHADHHAIAPFSSRGPLRDFSSPAAPKPLVADKPDLAAPGVKIDSAHSVATEVLTPRTPLWLSGVRFTPKGGTSMAAPVVAGAVALMLDKKGDLNTTEVRTALRVPAAGRPGARPAPPGAAHQHAFGAGMLDVLESHDDVP